MFCNVKGLAVPDSFICLYEWHILVTNGIEFQKSIFQIIFRENVS